MIEQGVHTKMVTLDNSSAKYYTGTIKQFNASMWDRYGNATSHYLNKKIA